MAQKDQFLLSWFLNIIVQRFSLDTSELNQKTTRFNLNNATRYVYNISIAMRAQASASAKA